LAQEATCEKNLAELLTRFGKVSDENKELLKALEKLRQTAARLEAEKGALAKEATELKQALRKATDEKTALDEELRRLRPVQLPPLSMDDVARKELVLKRVYTIRSGECFDHNGDRSCMYHSFVSEKGRKCYLVYKANRILSSDEAVRGIVDKSGRELHVVTIEVSETIRTWEKTNPDLLPLLMTY